jgi:RNA polymerase II subunit A C-terminal domain phosphatase SSU72
MKNDRFIIFKSKKGLNVRSFGTGKEVKLPGPSMNAPNIYDFNLTYEHMYKDLSAKDRTLYTQNGILHMLDRNRRIKAKPERFQECKDIFDIIYTVEERIFDQVIEGIFIIKKRLTKILPRTTRTV